MSCQRIFRATFRNIRGQTDCCDVLVDADNPTATEIKAAIASQHDVFDVILGRFYEVPQRRVLDGRITRI